MFFVIEHIMIWHNIYNKEDISSLNILIQILQEVALCHIRQSLYTSKKRSSKIAL